MKEKDGSLFLDQDPQYQEEPDALVKSLIHIEETKYY